MQSQKKIFDDIARIAGGAMSAIGAFKQEAETMIRDRVERFMAEHNYVRRDEFEAVKAVASAARAAQERLEARVAALERKRGGATKPKSETRARKSRANG
jgi:BMFP domain-containing protein YqiC